MLKTAIGVVGDLAQGLGVSHAPRLRTPGIMALLNVSRSWVVVVVVVGGGGGGGEDNCAAQHVSPFRGGRGGRRAPVGFGWVGCYFCSHSNAFGTWT